MANNYLQRRIIKMRYCSTHTHACYRYPGSTISR
ncbi:hypothetical protein CCACVL1_16003 [Corchorus capsularis]|uniref:Uncharacterized protein n=1 Tax=Corchorus capsularis TaxID=210143 RepID=A0A1R3HZY3_COCAP|nr:hypothetical protein CCACVL1_16003 [Corchorus capsularis]